MAGLEPYISDYAYNRRALDYLCQIADGLGATVSSPARDAFGRLRSSEPFTIFDSKLINYDKTLFWDDQEVSGTGTGSSYSADRSSTTISVADVTAGKRARQTFQRFNYQPGKSQLILLTGVIGAAAAGITKRWGYFDDDNGAFFELSGTTLSVGIRSSVSGSAVDGTVEQSAWTIDAMDGNGGSGITLDLTKANIFLIDIEWLGVGAVRFGVVIDGIPYYIHQIQHANIIDSVYMSSANLPLRYEIENDGAGPAATMEHICTSVISEGGQQETGITRAASTGGTHVDANAAGTVYAAIGLRPGANFKNTIIRAQAITMFSKTVDNFEWLLYLNPVVAGTFTYIAEANSAAEVAKGATANTITGGTVLQAGFSASSSAVTQIVDLLRYPGFSIFGAADELVLAVRPLSNNADIEATLTWKETA